MRDSSFCRPCHTTSRRLLPRIHLGLDITRDSFLNLRLVPAVRLTEGKHEVFYKPSRYILLSLFSPVSEGDAIRLNFVLKGEHSVSVEALHKRSAITELPDLPNVVHLVDENILLHD